LVRQAEMEVKRAEEWNDGKGFMKWETCFDCGQQFHGTVCVALGWAAWKMYLGRVETSASRCLAMGVLGSGLQTNQQFAEALPILEASLTMRQRQRRDKRDIFVAKSNLAHCLDDLGRSDEAIVIQREVYAGWVALLGVSHQRTILGGFNLCVSLDRSDLWDEARQFLRQLLPAALRSLGADNDLTLLLNQLLGGVLTNNSDCSRDDLLEAETILQDVLRRRRRVFGPAHPHTRACEFALSRVRAKPASAPSLGLIFDVLHTAVRLAMFFFRWLIS